MAAKLFNFKYLKGDFFGGITAGIVALPLALAFGVQSGLGAEAGLYGAIGIGIVASLFGGTNTQISGPTGPMTVVSAALIANLMSTSSKEDAYSLIILTFLLAGVFQVIFGLIRVGRYIKYIPYPVVSGFMSGIGVIIIILQIFPFFGKRSPARIVDILSNFNVAITDINWYSVLLASLTIAVVYLFPKITRAVPSTLVALIGISLIPVFIPMDIGVIGDIPRGLPDLTLGALVDIDLARVQLVLLPALTLAALGSIDSLLTSVVADNLTKTKHNSNKELFGQGLGNVASALIGGIPGAGATMRTVVNINAGGKTRISGILAGLLLLIVLVGAGPLASKIPLSVLAGILITVGIGIIDYKGLKDIARVPRADAATMLIVFVLTVLVDLLQAVAVGVVLASVLFIKRMADIAEKQTQIGPVMDYSSSEIPDSVRIIPKELRKDVFVKTIRGPLFFGFATTFQEMVSKLPDIKYVVLRMHDTHYIDQSGIYTLENIILDLKSKGVEVFLTGLQEQPRHMMEKIRIIPALVGENDIYSDWHGAMDRISKELKHDNEKTLPESGRADQ